jgi:NifU-like protein involved in Fe-S cluster formation/bacterioferritin-associated ferredoxin
MGNSSEEKQRWMYSATVKDHFFHPRNAFQEDEKFIADGEGEVGSPACGDLMRILIQVNQKTDRIKACRWSTFGCASAIASTSILSVMITEDNGMKISNALKLRPQHILNKLGGLPDKKVHCSVLGDEALREAIMDYFRKTEQENRIPITPEKRIICACKQVTDIDIEESVLEGATTLELVQKKTGAGTVCGNCIPDIETQIEQTKNKYFSNNE